MNYVQVAVPEEHVMAVYRLLVSLEQTQSTAAASSRGAAATARAEMIRDTRSEYAP